MSKVRLIDALDEVTMDDLKEVDREIDGMERRLSSLRQIRKVMEIRLVGKPEPAKGRGGGKSVAGRERRVKVAEYLIHAGPTRPLVIAQQCGIPSGSITMVLDHPWFVKEPNGVNLSPEGRKAVG